MASPRSVALTPEALLATVLDRYDLSPPANCAPLARGCNDLYRITTGGEPCVLKLYRSGWASAEKVQEEVEVLLHLGRKQVPVGLPLPGRDRRYVWALPTPEAERQAVLFTEARGEPVCELDEEICRRFGRALATLHGAMDDLPAAPDRYDLEQLLSRPLGALAPLLEDCPDDRIFLEELAATLRERIAALPEEALDRGYCHGDYRPANGHWDPETGTVTLFDFESVGSGFRAYDLATFCFRLTGEQPPERCERLTHAFVEGYAEHRRLDPANRKAVALFVPIRPIRILGNLLQTAHQNWKLEPWRPSRVAGLPAPDFFEEMLRFLQAWKSAGDGVELGDFEGFGEGEGRQEVARRRTSIVFPDPGGPTRSMFETVCDVRVEVVTSAVS